jgi:pyruvate,water dikinase
LALFEVVPPFVTTGAPPHSGTWERRDAQVSTRAEAAETITGVSGCTGTARGRARVLTSPDDPSALEPGEILIAPITDPAWTPLFVAAAAVLVDVGAPFSHAAIVSRELGIPCVLSATEASKRIPDGALIEVNGDTATVTILKHASQPAGG